MADLGHPVPEPPAALRAKLEEMLRVDLLGPARGEDEEIEEGGRVQDRYLLGVVAPKRLRLESEEMDGVEAQCGDSGEDGVSDPNAPPRSTMFPSSVGMSFCVAGDAGCLVVEAGWGLYRREKSATAVTEKGNPKTVWKRVPMGGSLALGPCREGKIGPERICADQPEVTVQGVCHRVGADFVVTLFLVNGQKEPAQNRDEAWLFQPRLSVRASDGSPVFRRRPEFLSVEVSAEERELAMRYRHRVEFATGHNIAVHVVRDEADPWRATRIETTVIPRHEVPRQTGPDESEEVALAGLVLDMKELAEAPRSELDRMLRPLPDAYAAWMRRQRDRVGAEGERLSEFAAEAGAALSECDVALSRIRDGLALLQGNEDAAKAFRFANRAMWHQRIRTTLAEAARRGKDVDIDALDVPENRSWRIFQLAFVLLNLDSVTNLHHKDRCDPQKALADLLFFPTGGGKTEAYLGLAAYVMALRRLQGKIGGRSGNHGVAVLMRYTLRLLTLQQFQRASALICAMEVLRREDPATLGEEPFRIGLWVGAKTTPNRTEHAGEALKLVRKVGVGQASVVAGLGSPVQLKNCPWCGTAIRKDRDYEVETFASGRQRTLVFCGDKFGRCEFTRKKSVGEGIPVLVVDDEIYRRLPALLIATVDKFAQMPWNGRVQMLFGRVNAECPRHGFVSPEIEDTNHKKKGYLPATQLKAHSLIRPPDLIIQDELHLISGPLGTLTGLYETAIDELCSWEVGGTKVRPKVIASTATIRQAPAQIHNLFLRQVKVFPPQGIDATDNFFSRERPVGDLPGRLYLGICTPGRRLKSTLIRVSRVPRSFFSSSAQPNGG